jgi:hypothetical protein
MTRKRDGQKRSNPPVPELATRLVEVRIAWVEAHRQVRLSSSSVGPQGTYSRPGVARLDDHSKVTSLAYTSMRSIYKQQNTMSAQKGTSWRPVVQEKKLACAPTFLFLFTTARHPQTAVSERGSGLVCKPKQALGVPTREDVLRAEEARHAHKFTQIRKPMSRESQCMPASLVNSSCRRRNSV